VSTQHQHHSRGNLALEVLLWPPKGVKSSQCQHDCAVELRENMGNIQLDCLIVEDPMEE
jgi:hypothetical protein